MKKINFEKLSNLAVKFIEKYSKNELFSGGLYPTQKRILYAIIKNFFSQSGRKVFISITRQYGKSTIVFKACIFIAIFAVEILGFPINIGISVPQRSQAKQNMDKLRENLKKILPDFGLYFEENNKTDIRLSNGCNFYVFSLEDGSNNESRTLHLSIVDESHKINDEKYNREIRPMLSNTNGNEVFIGVGGTRICEFYENITNQGKNDVFECNFLDALKEKQEYYEKTNDIRHLNYKKMIYGTEESDGMRMDTDEFRTEYMLDWILGIGNFIQRDTLLKMKGKQAYSLQFDGILYAGLDFAKKSDYTILTIVGIIDGKVKVVRWDKFQGDYKIQFQNIKEITSKYKIQKFFCDSTGVGDGIMDFLETFIGKNRLERVVFTPQNKHNMYTNLQMIFTDGFEYLDNEHTKSFEKEFIDLQREYKGNYLSCHHPDGNNYHDDYCDSLALACLFKTGQKYLVGNISK